MTPHLTAPEIELWSDGLLPAARTLHLADCPDCLAVAERERKLSRELAQLPRFEPGAGFVDRVLAKVEIPSTSAR